MRPPNLSPHPCLHIRHAQRPRLRAPPRFEIYPRCIRRNPNKRNLLTVRRPNRLAIDLCRRIEIRERLVSQREYADKPVIPALARERQVLPIRRPAQRPQIPAPMKELYRLCRRVPQIERPNLIAGEKRNHRAIGRNSRLPPRSQLPRIAAMHADNPDLLLQALRQHRRICRLLSGKLKVPATRINDLPAIRRPNDVPNVDAIVRIVARHPMHRIRRPARLSDPDIPLASLVRDPQKSSALGRRL